MTKNCDIPKIIDIDLIKLVSFIIFIIAIILANILIIFNVNFSKIINIINIIALILWIIFVIFYSRLKRIKYIKKIFETVDHPCDIIIKDFFQFLSKITIYGCNQIIMKKFIKFIKENFYLKNINKQKSRIIVKYLIKEMIKIDLFELFYEN